jgi:hypothetical protein
MWTILKSRLFWELLVLGAVCAYGWFELHHQKQVRFQAGYAQRDTELQLQAAKANEDARSKEQALQQQLQEQRAKNVFNQQTAAKRQLEAQNELDGLRMALRDAGLRIDVASNPAAATLQAAADSGPAAREHDLAERAGGALGVCAATAVQLAQDADRLTEQLRQLQGWARTVFLELGSCKP